jgi:hypothetical protein
MKKIDDQYIIKKMQNSGFNSDSLNFRICIAKGKNDIFSAYFPQFIRKKGKFRFDGAIGIYVKKFEFYWRSVISKIDQKNDYTLPIISNIGNFLNILGNDFFEFYDFENTIDNNIKKIYDLCNSELMPNSHDRLYNCIVENSLFDKPLLESMHLFHYNENSLYFRKSASFLMWYCREYPDASVNIQNLINDQQRIIIEDLMARKAL